MVHSFRADALMSCRCYEDMMVCEAAENRILDPTKSPHIPCFVPLLVLLLPLRLLE